MWRRLRRPGSRGEDRWRLGEKGEGGEGGEDAHETGGDRGDGGGFGEGDPRPHIEEGGEVAVGFAEESVLAAVAGAHGGDLGVGHGAEEGEEAADDPDGIDGSGAAGGGHHLTRDEKDTGADDDADDDGGGVARVEDAGKLLRGVWRAFGHGCMEGSTGRFAVQLAISMH